MILLVKVLVVFVLLMVSVLFMVMYERKAIARLGNRWGPNRAGPNGWLQSLADGIKLFFKEALLPATADKLVYQVAPGNSAGPGVRGLLHRARRRDDHHRRLHHPAPAGRPAVGDPVLADVLERLRVRGDAGRLGVGLASTR